MSKRSDKRTPKKLKVIVDPGSTHCGEYKKAKELVCIASDAGADAIKFQLLGPEQEVGGNVGMDWNWFPKLMEIGQERGIEVFASVFNLDGWRWLIKCGCTSVKLSYSQISKLSQYPHVNPLKDYYVSLDCMTPNGSWPTLTPQKVDREAGQPGPMNLHKLYCIPLYPVPYIVDFEGLFPRFDGFSDHTLGIEQTVNAVDSGAKIIEKHIQGEWFSDVPDGRFALRPKDLDKLIKRIK